MSLAMAVFTFINAWWVCLFMALPFGRRDAKEGEKQEDIAYKAAPAMFYWKKTFVVATVLAFCATLILALIANSGFFHMDTLA